MNSPRALRRRVVFPIRLQERAAELGSDELMALAEWTFRSRPRESKHLRRRHVAYCVALLPEIKRAR